MLLFVLQEYSPDEICEATGLDKRAVYRRTFRARTRPFLSLAGRRSPEPAAAAGSAPTVGGVAPAVRDGTGAVVVVRANRGAARTWMTIS